MCRCGLYSRRKSGASVNITRAQVISRNVYTALLRENPRFVVKKKDMEYRSPDRYIEATTLRKRSDRDITVTLSSYDRVQRDQCLFVEAKCFRYVYTVHDTLQSDVPSAFATNRARNLSDALLAARARPMMRWSGGCRARGAALNAGTLSVIRER